MDWLDFFEEFFTQRAESIAVIADAAGCREGWLQGEFFLCGRQMMLRTNATRRRFDLLCDDPPMIAEIKLCGGGYATKMKAFIENDVRKLRSDPSCRPKYMILVVDNRKPHTSLGRWLTTCSFPHTRERMCTLSEKLLVRIWEVASARHGTD